MPSEQDAVARLVVTAVDAQVDPAREPELIDGFQRMSDGNKPDGLVRSELLRGQEGTWRIQTTWRDFDSLMAMRKSGQPPAALELLESVGATHSHAWCTVEVAFGVS